MGYLGCRRYLYSPLLVSIQMIVPNPYSKPCFRNKFKIFNERYFVPCTETISMMKYRMLKNKMNLADAMNDNCFHYAVIIGTMYLMVGSIFRKSLSSHIWLKSFFFPVINLAAHERSCILSIVSL